jgi:hypothetical protein
MCDQKRIFKAYRLICELCATAKKEEGILLCTKCGVNVKTVPNNLGKMHYAVPGLSNNGLAPV